jgi:hypothetical protein
VSRIRLRGAEPIEVRDVRVFQGFLVEQRKEPRKERAEAILPVVARPVETDSPGEPSREPADDVERVVRREGGPGNPGNLGRVEGGSVGAGSGERLDALGEPEQKRLGGVPGRAVVRIGAQEEQCLVETDEAFRVSEPAPLERPEETNRLARVGPLRFRRLQPGEEPFEGRAQSDSPRISSTAERVGSISTGRFAPGGGGSISW